MTDRIEPGSPEWRERMAAILAEEAKQPVQWWYLSFGDETGFLGGCVVRAQGGQSAIRRSHQLGINPGGSVMIVRVGDDKGPLPADRLLSAADLEKFGPGDHITVFEEQ